MLFLYRNFSTLNMSLFLNYFASMFLLILGAIIMLIITGCVIAPALC